MIGCFLAFAVIGTFLVVAFGPWLLFFAAIAAIVLATIFLVAITMGAKASKGLNLDYSQDRLVIGTFYVFGILTLIILGLYGFYDFWF